MIKYHEEIKESEAELLAVERDKVGANCATECAYYDCSKAVHRAR
jgi:hypothetical protein